MKNLIIFIISEFLLFSAFHFQQKGNRNYFKNEFRFEEISRIEPRLIQFEDTIPNDTIYICFTTNNFPYAYFREIFTNVCSDKLCLPVWMLFYWSPGGDYLGYSLKDNGFFTKLEHIPFEEEDYLRLHYLLDDPQSLLNKYKLTELVSYDKDTIKVDGITSATIADVENYVIKGAAYTTYTLWQTVYGPSYDSIRNITLEYISNPFLESLMYSPNIEDNYYALNILNRFEPQVTIGLIPKLEEFINSDNYSLKENSINALMFSEISDSLIQETLLNVFKESDYWTKLMVLSKLHTFTFLLPDIIEKLISDLSKESPSIIQKILNLLENRAKLSLISKIKVANLLEHDNRFIAKVAYNYLSSLDNNEKILLDKIHKYEVMINQK
ncbi:MAG: hypothetical protein KAU83_08005 [Bacteroidales bacterium]|nr:hypothetical protein [Bacteroidales bacterium]